MRHPGNPVQWLRWLTEGNAEARKRATLILGGLEPDDDADPAAFLVALASRNDDVVFWSIVALPRIGTAAARAVPTVAVLARTHDAFGTRQACLSALKEIAPRVCSLSRSQVNAHPLAGPGDDRAGDHG